MNGYGNSVFLRTAFEVSSGVAPVNTVAPAITGTAQEGETVTCSTGTWTGTPTITFAYQWKRNGSNIGSATNSTYVLVTADVSQSITCQVTATNGSGSASATSNTITPIAAVDPDAQAFITAAAITDPTQQAAINTLVVDLKGYSIWTKMNALYPIVGGTASQHKYNLKDPRDLDAAFRLVFSGGVTHNANGMTGNGTNGFANTKLADSTLNANNKHLSIYQRNILAEPSASPMGSGGNSNRFYLNYLGSNYSTLAIIQSPYAVVAPQKGFMALSKVTATPTTYKFYQNDLTPTSRTSAAVSSIYNYHLLADNSTGAGFDYSLSNLAFASIGAGLTDTEITNLKTSVLTFQTTLGRNV
jgi:hypothetical protein